MDQWMWWGRGVSIPITAWRQHADLAESAPTIMGMSRVMD